MCILLYVGPLLNVHFYKFTSFMSLLQSLQERAGSKPFRFQLLSEGKQYELSAPDLKIRNEWINGEFLQNYQKLSKSLYHIIV